MVTLKVSSLIEECHVMFKKSMSQKKVKSITFTFVSQFGTNFEIKFPLICRLLVDTNVPKRNPFS